MTWLWWYLAVSVSFCCGWVLAAAWLNGNERRWCANCSQAREPRQPVEIPDYVFIIRGPGQRPRQPSSN